MVNIRKTHIVRRRKLSSRSVAGDVIIFLFLAFLGTFMALPLVYAVVTAFKPIEELFVFPPTFWVKRPTIKNFV